MRIAAGAGIGSGSYTGFAEGGQQGAERGAAERDGGRPQVRGRRRGACDGGPIAAAADCRWLRSQPDSGETRRPA
jgi:hypothetical protein